jgi:hypothetical protein
LNCEIELKIMRRDESSREGDISAQMYPLVLLLIHQQQPFDERAEKSEKYQQETLMHRNNWLLRPPNLHITPVVRRDFRLSRKRDGVQKPDDSTPHRLQRVFREHQRRFSDRTSRQLR